MGVVSTPPLTPPASPERLMPTREPSRPFLCGINGSTSAESFTSCRHRRRVIGHQQPEKLLSYVTPCYASVFQVGIFVSMHGSSTVTQLDSLPCGPEATTLIKIQKSTPNTTRIFLTNHCCPQRQEYRPKCPKNMRNETNNGKTRQRPC